MVDQALSDPLWGRTFDLAYEAEVAALARARLTREPRHRGDQMDADVQRLIDRQEIADLCVRYTFALDTKDWALLESCFTGAPAFVYPGGRLEGFEAILTRARGALEPLDASQHLLGNVVADVDGDTARATCYFQAQHVRAGTPGGDTYIIAGSYADTLARTASGWKIAERCPGLPVARRQPRCRQAMSAPEGPRARQPAPGRLPRPGPDIARASVIERLSPV